MVLKVVRRKKLHKMNQKLRIIFMAIAVLLVVGVTELNAAVILHADLGKCLFELVSENIIYNCVVLLEPDLKTVCS